MVESLSKVISDIDSVETIGVMTYLDEDAQSTEFGDGTGVNL
jgi:hypothetical protein